MSTGKGSTPNFSPLRPRDVRPGIRNGQNPGSGYARDVRKIDGGDVAAADNANADFPHGRAHAHDSIVA
jgi:hypothetical protein